MSSVHRIQFSPLIYYAPLEMILRSSLYSRWRWVGINGRWNNLRVGLATEDATQEQIWYARPWASVLWVWSIAEKKVWRSRPNGRSNGQSRYSLSGTANGGLYSSALAAVWPGIRAYMIWSRCTTLIVQVIYKLNLWLWHANAKATRTRIDFFPQRLPIIISLYYKGFACNWKATSNTFVGEWTLTRESRRLRATSHKTSQSVYIPVVWQMMELWYCGFRHNKYDVTEIYSSECGQHKLLISYVCCLHIGPTSNRWPDAMLGFLWFPCTSSPSI